MPVMLSWTVAVLAILGGAVAFYLSSRHQRLLRAPPSRRRLRLALLVAAVTAYVALCQVVAITTAFFVLALLGMGFCTYLPLLIAALSSFEGSAK